MSVIVLCVTFNNIPLSHSVLLLHLLFHVFMLKFLQKLCNNNAYHIVYFILYVYGEDNTKLKKLCLILLSLFRE
jgi:hypothetical protein